MQILTYLITKVNTALHLAVMNDGIKSIVNKPLIMSILARTNVNILTRNIPTARPLLILYAIHIISDDAVQPVDFSSLLSTCVPHSTHYKAVKKFAKTIKNSKSQIKLESITQINRQTDLFARLFGTAPAATIHQGQILLAQLTPQAS